MSNKKIMEEGSWVAPLSSEVDRVVRALGGKSAVCRVTKKHRNTVSKWCNGEGKSKIDFANWRLLNQTKEKDFNKIARELCDAWEREPWLIEMLNPKMRQQLIDFIK